MAERRQYVKKRNHLSSHLKVEKKPSISLLEQARAAKIIRKRHHKIYTEDELELALAWLNDDIEMVRVQKVLNFRNSFQCYVFFARCARILHQRRMDVIYEQEKKKHESNS